MTLGRALLAALSLPLLAACAAPPAAKAPEPAFVAISDEDAFRAAVVSRVLRNGNSTLTLTEDGAIEGEVSSGPVEGRWEWVDGRYCREVAAGSREFPYACQRVEMAGDKVRFIGDDERAPGVWTVEG